MKIDGNISLDLYDMYPNKWVVTINSEWENGDIVRCEVFGVFDTEGEAIDAENEVDLNGSGLFKMVKEEDELEFAPCQSKYISKEVKIMRVNFRDLYDLYPNKWVVTINEEWKNGDIDVCEVFGVFDTEKEATEAVLEANLHGYGFSKMVKEEDELGFIFIITN